MSRSFYCPTHRCKMIEDFYCDSGIHFYCPKCEPEMYKQEIEEIENRKYEEKKAKKLVPLKKQLELLMNKSLKYYEPVVNVELFEKFVNHFMTYGLSIKSINHKEKFGMFDKDRIKSAKQIWRIGFVGDKK